MRIGPLKVTTTAAAITTTTMAMPLAKQMNKPHQLPHKDHREEADGRVIVRIVTEKEKRTVAIIDQVEIDGDMTGQEVVEDAAEAAKGDLPETKDDTGRKMATISKLHLPIRSVRILPMRAATKKVLDGLGPENDKAVPVHRRRERRKTRCLPEETEDMISTIVLEEASGNVVTNRLPRPRAIHMTTATHQRKRSEVDVNHLGSVDAEEAAAVVGAVIAAAAGEEAAAVPGTKTPMATLAMVTTTITPMDEVTMVIREHLPTPVMFLLQI